MPTVNPEILVWARETAGLTLKDAVAQVGIRKARGVTDIDRLRALERGDEQPTRPTLVKMARQYRRPLLAFYLNAPPRRDRSVPDFRTLHGSQSAGTDALVDALVRNLRSRQQMVRSALEAEDEAEPLPFVGALIKHEGTDSGIESFCQVLRTNPKASRLLRRALNLLNQVLGDDMSAARYYREQSAENAFKLLRSRAEDAGVFVLLAGDLGSYHTAIDVEAFRGLAIADEVAPFVVINPNDSKPARSFTLLHELTHLLLGQSGFGGAGTEAGTEKFCNTVAAHWLMPALDEIDIPSEAGLAELQQHIGQFATKRNLSRSMVAYRMLRSGCIDPTTFERLQAEFRKQWQQHRSRSRTAARKSSGGPSYHAVRRHCVGQGLLGLTSRLLGSGALSTTKAARVLGVKPAHVGKMLRPTWGL